MTGEGGLYEIERHFETNCARGGGHLLNKLQWSIVLPTGLRLERTFSIIVDTRLMPIGRG